jgi:hypothetical protein
MESGLKVVERVEMHAGSSSYIQGSTLNDEYQRKRNNLRWMLYTGYVVLGVY